MCLCYRKREKLINCYASFIEKQCGRAARKTIAPLIQMQYSTDFLPPCHTTRQQLAINLDQPNVGAVAVQPPAAQPHASTRRPEVPVCACSQSLTASGSDQPPQPSPPRAKKSSCFRSTASERLLLTTSFLTSTSSQRHLAMLFINVCVLIGSLVNIAIDQCVRTLNIRILLCRQYFYAKRNLVSPVRCR